MKEPKFEQQVSAAEKNVHELRFALESQNQEDIEWFLSKIGEGVNEAWGSTMPVYVMKEDDRFVVTLATGSSGERLILNTGKSGQYLGDLIFPNAGRNKVKNDNLTLAEAFAVYFGSLAENIQTDEDPYFVVKVSGEGA
jgi:hypothetical protein